MIGIYGGTFDPIHYGHLRSALEVAEQLSLLKVLMIPSAQPPHRETPEVSAQHRWQMLQLALNGQTRLLADDREILRDGPSYTYDTLVSLREELGSQPLCLIQGADVFARFNTWHRWRELPDLAHIIVMSRAGERVTWSDEVKQQFAQAKASDAAELLCSPAGKICEVAVTPLQISATDIRQRLSQQKEVRYLIPDSVLTYIERHQLYQHA